MSGSDLDRAIDSLCVGLEEGLSADQLERIDSRQVQRLLAAAIRLYAAKQQDGARLAALLSAESVSQTEAAVAVSGILESTGLELFEVAMWQVLGRP